MNSIAIVGLGLEREDLTARADALLRGAERILLRTEHCGAAAFLRAEGIAYEALDALYDEAEDFDGLNRLLTERVLAAAGEGDVLYGVLDLRDQSVAALVERCAENVRLVPGVAVDGALTAFAKGAYTALAASDWPDYQPDSDQGTLLREIDSRELAAEVKLRLMERYPAEETIYVLGPDGALQRRALLELDRLDVYGHRLAAFIPAQTELTSLERYGFDQLNRIIRRLRAPDGCPWDIKQTHESLRTNVVEEAYEVVDAIDRGDVDALYDELGDLLLQVSLHAEIARQHGEFAVDDVTTAISRKMISRHPHIFSSAVAETADEVLLLWEDVKRQEKHQQTRAEAMRSVTAALPALMRAEKVQKRAADVGFDWDDAREALDKVREEADEVTSALSSGAGLEEELGDLLFACVNVCRLAKVQPELALSGAVQKFTGRFEAMERKILAAGRRLEEMTLPQMDVYWDQVKAEEKNKCV